ncbi:Aldo/keto reductase [Ceratobasidium sp. AG-I]|nr:Aldo/keto reductase [Ceratobasidium sp. AG-I]
MASTTEIKKMKYVRLGNSGLKISQIILGMMSYGDPRWQGWLLGEEEGIAHVKAAYELGIQTFDTANVYSNGQSEVILGKAIKQLNLPRDEIVVMTKVRGVVRRSYDDGVPPMAPEEVLNNHGYVNQYGLSRKHIFESIKHSLERLQLDYVDLLQCHRFDPSTPIEETMHALHDIVQAGYVRYIGMSSCAAWQFHAMQNYAIANKLTPFISMQNCYSLLYREEEREMMPTLNHFGVGSIPWAPLASGRLARPLANNTAREGNDKFIKLLTKYSDTESQIISRVEEVAKAKGVSMAQVSLAWMLSKDFVSAPIVGTTNLKNLEDIAGAVHITLSEDDIKKLEEPYTAQEVVKLW